MKPLRARFARLSLLLGLTAWLLGLSAAQVHRLLVQHVVCAEHGDVLELDSSRAAPSDEVSITSKADHDHDCPLEGIATQSVAAQTLSLPPPLAEPIVAPRLGALVDGVRGPPLAYAPKTSPPTTSC
ncbi:MAG: hypothetical protein H6741_29915 [Alphaproteobacteria bacterium]|nr:hypothetical protein [Alphaproteobacteria bacterium]MCB9796920.1 hypothetical protein [Alphaproteobacteria bacterium]